MRIIKAKHIQPKEIFCTGCGAELEYTKVDIKYSQVFGKYFVICPLCGKSLIID
jgi:predicted RNA-binding Zn-ribbon protein involved in translation (DUF1610 family)